jgi:hypothetical protein
VDEVVTGMTDDCDVVVVVGATRITPRNYVVKVDSLGTIKGTYFATILYEPGLAGTAAPHEYLDSL